MPIVPYKYKISRDQITYGPREPDEVTAFIVAGELTARGYRRTSNAYCRVGRIDREDWLDVLAAERHCSRADFYNVDGSGIGDRHRDHYVRTFTKDRHTVAPEVIRLIPPYV